MAATQSIASGCVGNRIQFPYEVAMSNRETPTTEYSESVPGAPLEAILCTMSLIAALRARPIGISSAAR